MPINPQTAAHVLDLEPYAARMLVGMFDGPTYSRASGLEGDDEALFSHFLAEGLVEGHAFSPWYDVEYAAQALESVSLTARRDDPRALLVSFLREGRGAGLSPSPMFDEAFYVKTYPNVLRGSGWGFQHFINNGEPEGRPPNEVLSGLCEFIRAHRDDMQPRVLRRLLEITPAGAVEEIWGQEHPMGKLRRFVWPQFYAHIAGLDPLAAEDDITLHFARTGLLAGIRPNLAYNDAHYRRQITEARLAGSEIPAIGEVESAFLHWVAYGFPARICPTGLFIEEIYTDRHRDLRQTWSRWIFEHFFMHGYAERRQMSDVFDPVWYAATAGLGPRESSLVHYALHGEAEGRDPHPQVNINSMRVEGDPVSGLKLEALADILKAKRDRLETPEIRALAARAAAIEPMVVRHPARRQLNWQPIKHTSTPAMRVGELIRRRLEKPHYDNVVLIPHCRMAGSARVAGAITKALGQVVADESVLVINTELSVFEKPEWFGEGYDRFDFAEAVHRREPGLIAQALLDLIRGLRPKRVINVNSRAGWHLFEGFGKQLSQEMDLMACLFTWDLDIHGRKGGYPIEAFQRCFDNLSKVIFDNQALADELSERYCLPKSLAERFHVLRIPPADHTDADHSGHFARRREAGEPLTAIWAGRLDRQKRFDLVMEIARLMPELKVLAHGKAVLDDYVLVEEDLPFNITMMEPFERHEDSAIGDADFLLYTSQWDGLPNVPIEFGLRGMPVVASRVGGVGELITEETGWAVEDALNPQAYVDAIRSMASDVDDVTRRAAALRASVREDFTEARFAEGLAQVLGVSPPGAKGKRHAAE